MIILSLHHATQLSCPLYCAGPWPDQRELSPRTERCCNTPLSPLYYCIIVLYCMDSTEFTAAGRCNPWHGQPGTGGRGQCGNLVSVPGPWSHGHNSAGHCTTSLENGDTGSADLGTFSSCSYCSRHLAPLRQRQNKCHGIKIIDAASVKKHKKIVKMQGMQFQHFLLTLNLSICTC